jgi:hypothetical protein
MALPKKRKLTVPIKRVDPQGGPENWVNQFLEKNKQFLPRTVDHGDLDKGFIEFVNNELGIVVKEDQVPVHAFSIQRWNEFAKTWSNSDKYGNIKIPFISVVRKPDAQMGTNPADFKIPVRKNFPYMKVPVWNGNRKGMDIHTIPNPVGVDLTYTVRFFSYRQRELNIFNQRVLQEFASAQAYINVKGHYFPILLESIGDESQITDLNNKRYYVQTYEMKLQGYLVDSEEFEVTPAVTRAFISTEIMDKSIRPVVRFLTDDDPKDRSLKCVIQFLVGSPTSVRIDIDTRTNFTTVDTENISSYTIRKNGTPVTVPFSAQQGDTLIVDIVKENSNQISEIILRGLVPI